MLGPIISNDDKKPYFAMHDQFNREYDRNQTLLGNTTVLAIMVLTSARIWGPPSPSALYVHLALSLLFIWATAYIILGNQLCITRDTGCVERALRIAINLAIACATASFLLMVWIEHTLANATPLYNLSFSACLIAVAGQISLDLHLFTRLSYESATSL